MTMRFTLTLTAEADGGAGRTTERSVVAVIERDALVPETLGLTLAEAKEVLGRVQEAVAADQVATHAGRPGAAPPAGSPGACGAIARSPAAPPSARSGSRPSGCAAAGAAPILPPATVPPSVP
jgi:hypothetical protein